MLNVRLLKQNRYAFYHQSAPEIAGYLADLPYKIVNMFIFNILIYLMADLRREAFSSSVNSTSNNISSISCLPHVSLSYPNPDQAIITSVF